MIMFATLFLSVSLQQFAVPAEAKVADHTQVQSWICQLELEPETGARRNSCLAVQAILHLEHLYKLAFAKKVKQEQITHVFCERTVLNLHVDAVPCDPAPLLQRVNRERYRILRLIAQTHRETLATVVPTTHP